VIPVSRSYYDDDGELASERFDLDPRALEIDFANLGDDASRAAAELGLLAELIGDYEQRHADAATEYRVFLAKETENILESAGPKSLSQWKAQSRVKKLPEFRERKEEADRLQATLTMLRNFFVAMQVKAAMLHALLKQAAQEPATVALDVPNPTSYRRPLTRVRNDVVAVGREHILGRAFSVEVED